MATPINKILTNQQQVFSPEELANVSASLSAILGQGGGGGEPCASAWLPSVSDAGVISWTLTTATTEPTTANIKGPSGDRGPAGTSGTNGTDGKDGISPTFTIAPTAGGTHVTISGAQGEEGFDVLSGAKGADGQNGQNGAPGADGISPTFTTSVTSDEQHPQGGTHVVISGAGGESAFNVWNGVDGEGATVNLFGNNGVSVTKDGTNYTVGLSGGYYSDTLSAYSAAYAGEAKGFRWGDNTYQDTSAALTNLWNAKNHVTLQTADNILTVDNNDNTSATLSAMGYVGNTAHAGWLPQKTCVCQDSEIYAMSLLADGQGMLFFVVSAH